MQLLAILCMAWLFYSLDGAVISVLITNENFIKASSLVQMFTQRQPSF